MENIKIIVLAICVLVNAYLSVSLYKQGSHRVSILNAFTAGFCSAALLVALMS